MNYSKHSLSILLLLTSINHPTCPTFSKYLLRSIVYTTIPFGIVKLVLKPHQDSNWMVLTCILATHAINDLLSCITIDNNTITNSSLDNYIPKEDELIALSDVTLPEKLRTIIDILNNKEQQIPYQFTLDVPKGILLYGPTGSGKTTIVKTLAGKLNAKIFVTNGNNILSTYVGNSEYNIRAFFAQADIYLKQQQQQSSSKFNSIKHYFRRNRANNNANTKISEMVLLFIDEIDAIGQKRSADTDSGSKSYNSIVNALLTAMRGLQSNPNVIVIGATNHIEILDDALKNRFSEHIEIPLPNRQTRKAILESIWHARVKQSEYIPDFEDLSQQTEGANCTDLNKILTDALLVAYRNKSTTIKLKHVEHAINEFKLSKDATTNKVLELLYC